jgi:hypothetical protein
MLSGNDKPEPYNSYARASMQSNDSFRASQEFGNLGHSGFIFGNNILTGSNGFNHPFNQGYPFSPKPSAYDIRDDPLKNPFKVEMKRGKH